MNRIVVLPMLLVFLALFACSDGESRGPIILTVDGVPVYESDFEEQLDYELSFRDIVEERGDGDGIARLTEDELKTKILSKMLIPLAAVKARYAKRIPLLLKEAEKVKAKIRPGGANFAELAATYSKDTNARYGGSWGVFTRFGLYHPIPRVCFTAEEGAIVGPVLSLVGCHLIFIEEKRRGTLASGDTVRASHILFPYEESRPDYMTTVLEEIVQGVDVKVLEPKYKRYVRLFGD